MENERVACSAGDAHTFYRRDHSFWIARQLAEIWIASKLYDFLLLCVTCIFRGDVFAMAARSRGV